MQELTPRLTHRLTIVYSSKVLLLLLLLLYPPRLPGKEETKGDTKDGLVAAARQHLAASFTAAAAIRYMKAAAAAAAAAAAREDCGYRPRVKVSSWSKSRRGVAQMVALPAAAPDASPRRYIVPTLLAVSLWLQQSLRHLHYARDCVSLLLRIPAGPALMLLVMLLL